MSETREPPTESPSRNLAASYGLALLLVALATVAAVVMDRLISVPNLSLVFVLPVVLAAVTFGWGPALAAAVAGVVAYNFFLIPPLYTFRVADPANVWALALLLIAAGIVSAVAAQSRRRALAAIAAAQQASALQVLAHDLAGASSRQRIVTAGAAALHRLFEAPVAILWAGEAQMEMLAQDGGATLSDHDREAARWALATRLPTRAGAYPTERASYDFWPLVTPLRTSLVIGIAFSDAIAGRPDHPERLVDAVSSYLAVALDREEYARQRLESRIQQASEQLKSNLLAAVSHDLKTPLATILITLQSLRKFPGARRDNARDELLALAETETARLDQMVAALLDMNRLDAGAVPVRAGPMAPTQIVADARRRAERALAGHVFINEVAASAPDFQVDATLFESALANVLENAGKYAPAGSRITVRAGSADGMGWIEVLDEGPGFGGAPEPLFEKFARGVSGDGRPPGTGLGLAIAKGFLEAQGGSLEAGAREDQSGAWVRLRVPLAVRQGAPA